MGGQGEGTHQLTCAEQWATWAWYWTRAWLRRIRLFVRWEKSIWDKRHDYYSIVQQGTVSKQEEQRQVSTETESNQRCWAFELGNKQRLWWLVHTHHCWRNYFGELLQADIGKQSSLIEWFQHQWGITTPLRKRASEEWNVNDATKSAGFAL